MGTYWASDEGVERREEMSKDPYRRTDEYLAPRRAGGFGDVDKIKATKDRKRAAKAPYKAKRRSPAEAQQDRYNAERDGTALSTDERITMIELAAHNAYTLEDLRVRPGMQFRGNLMSRSFSSLSVEQLTRCARMQGCFKTVKMGRAWVGDFRDAALAALKKKDRAAAAALELSRPDALLPGEVAPKGYRNKSKKARKK